MNVKCMKKITSGKRKVPRIITRFMQILLPHVTIDFHEILLMNDLWRAYVLILMHVCVIFDKSWINFFLNLHTFWRLLLKKGTKNKLQCKFPKNAVNAENVGLKYVKKYSRPENDMPLIFQPKKKYTYISSIWAERDSETIYDMAGCYNNKAMCHV